MIRRIIRFTFCLLLAFSFCVVNVSEGQKVKAAGEDFEGNEDYYYSLCSTYGLSNEEKATCRLFQDYLSDKVERAKEQAAATQEELENLKASIDLVAARINELQVQINDLNDQIDDVNHQIEVLTGNINALQEQIEIRNKNIDNLNNAIMERMVNIQPYVSLNKFIEFIMGATDFVDMLRRISAINEIMAYDTTQIELLTSEKEALKRDMDDLQLQKDTLAENEALLEEARSTVQAAQSQQRDLMDYYRRQMEQQEILLREQQDLIEGLSSQIDQIADTIGYVSPSPGFIYPIEGQFWITGVAWNYYPGGPSHRGLDFAADVWQYDVAVANGVVAYVHDGEPQYGYLGNYAGIPTGAGNSVCIICTVGGETYGFFYYHMSPGILVSPGEIVRQGQRLGHVGSSGNSTGPHTHLDVYYLGNMSLSNALRLFGTSISFGAGWTSAGYCDNRSAPCRLNPTGLFNVYYGMYYPG